MSYLSVDDYGRWLAPGLSASYSDSFQDSGGPGFVTATSDTPPTPFHIVPDLSRQPEARWLGEWKRREVPVLNGSIIGYRAWTLPCAEPLASGSLPRLDYFKSWELYGRWGRWTPGVNEACHAGCHPAPAPACVCGFNALARFEDDHAWWQTAGGRADVWGTLAIPGAIEAWSEDPGLVTDAEAQRQTVRESLVAAIEADGPITYWRLSDPSPEQRHIQIDPPGFRAPFAKIVLLAIDDEWPVEYQASVRAAAAHYGADTCKREHLEDAAKEHGQLVSDEMLEWAKSQRPPPSTDPYRYSGFQVVFPRLSAAGTTMRDALAVFDKAIQAWTHSLIKVDRAVVLLNRQVTRMEVVAPSAAPKDAKLRLKTVGPPGYGKHSYGDVVEDRRGDRYECVKPGKNGHASWRKL